MTRHRLGYGRYAGHVDVEVIMDRRAKREDVIAAALPGIKFTPRRTRVTNLVGGQWGVRFYP